MATGFDPYYKWLGIPPDEQPPNHYRLLGLRKFESDPEVIEAASDQRMAHLRNYQSGQYSALSQKLLNEVASAKFCLLSAEKRAKYDQTLKSSVPEMALAARPPAAGTPTPPVPPPMPIAPPPSNNHILDLQRLGMAADFAESPPPVTSAMTDAISGRKRSESPWDDSPEQAVILEEPQRPQPRRRRSWLVPIMMALVLLLGLGAAGIYFAKNYFHLPAEPVAPAVGSDPASPANAPSANVDPKPIPTGAVKAAGGAPLPTAPAAGETLPNPDPPTGVMFSWQPHANASSYWLQVEAPHQAKRMIDKPNVQATSAHLRLRKPVPKAECRGWQWRVRAMVNGKWTEWSESRTFDFAEPAMGLAPPAAAQSNPPEKPQSGKPAENEKPGPPAMIEKPVEKAVEKPAEAARPVAKRPLPSEADRKAASQTVRDLYAKRYAAARTAEERQALAEDMLSQAEESAGNPAAQYALMDRARVLLANAGDAETALQVTESLAAHFQIDPLPLKLETLTDSIEAGAAVGLQAEIVGPAVLATMADLGRAERYDAALRLGGLYREHAAGRTKASIMRRLTSIMQSLRDAQQEAAKVAGARKTLKTHPDDPAACAAVGRWLCIFQGNWEAGLPLLARGSDGPLKDIARLEQSGPQSASDRSKLADRWYDRAEKEPSRPLKLAFYRRALYWYEKCVSELTGGERSRAQQRMDRITPMAE